MNVVLRLTEAAVEFLWGGWGWVCKVIFMSNPTTTNYVEVVLRCVVVGVVTIK